MVESRLLPIRPTPFDDELLSSWLIRIANAYGMKLQTFCNILWPGRPIWSRDIDRCADGEFLASISRTLGTPRVQLESMLLRSYAGRLFSRFNLSGNTRWIMPLGIFHRIRRRTGLQFCPECLRAVPYFRKQWRLSLFVMCAFHERLLLDCCPACRAPIQIHRCDIGREAISRVDCASCYACGLNLRTVTAARVPGGIAAQQRRCYDVLKYSQPDDAVCERFDVLAHLVRILCSSNQHLAGFRKCVSRLCGSAIPDPVSRDAIALHFDVLNAGERLPLLYAADWLMQEWPRSFAAACEASAMHASYLLKDFRQPPHWFEETARAVCVGSQNVRRVTGREALRAKAS